jgi:hypothetical protein
VDAWLRAGCPAVDPAAGPASPAGVPATAGAPLSAGDGIARIEAHYAGEEP